MMVLELGVGRGPGKGECWLNKVTTGVITAETTAGLVLRTELKTGNPQTVAPGTLQ